MYIILPKSALPSLTSNPQRVELCGICIESVVYCGDDETGRAVCWFNPDQRGYHMDTKSEVEPLVEGCGGEVLKNWGQLKKAYPWIGGTDEVTDPETLETYEVPRVRRVQEPEDEE